MTDELTRAIARRADSLALERLLRKKGLWEMALEIKGLKTNMMKLQARVDRLNQLAISSDEKGALLESHLGDIGNQIGSHVDDIEFAANVLGNSPPSSDVSEPPFQAPGAGDSAKSE